MRVAHHVLHALRDVEADVGGGPARAPGDVAEQRPIGRDAVQPLKQVLNPLRGGADAGRRRSGVGQQ
jgi:hypothetical protein